MSNVQCVFNVKLFFISLIIRKKVARCVRKSQEEL